MSTRCQAVTFLLLCLACWSSLRFALESKRAFDSSQQNPDAVALHEEKFHALRAALPGVASLRYISDQGLDPFGLLDLVDAYAEAIHQYVKTGEVPASPRISTGVAKELGDFYLARNPDIGDFSVQEVRGILIPDISVLQRDSRLALIRYVFAPHQVVSEPGPDLILGDFDPQYDYRELADREGLELVEDYGNGAVLFRPRKQ